MLKLNKIFSPLVLLCLLILTSALALPDKIVGRNLFYISTVFLIVSYVLNYKKIVIKKENILLFLSFLAVSVSQFIWVKLYPPVSSEYIMANSNYPRTALYLFIGSFIVLLSPSLLNLVQYNKKNCKIIIYIALISLLYMGGKGLFYMISDPTGRLRISSAATMSAYLFMLQSLFTLYIINIMSFRNNILYIGIIFIFSFIVILCTQTRAVIILYPVLVLLYFIVNRQFSFKKLIFSGVMVAALGYLFIGYFFQSVEDRMYSAYHEISGYSENNNSSFGARITMWKSGLHAAKMHPTGQSTDSRLQEVNEYISQYENGNPEAIRNLTYHLHNDIIESASLQGIWGVMALIFLFISMNIFFYYKGTWLSAFPLLILAVSGVSMVDTLFIDDRFIIMLCILTVLFTTRIKSKS
ncbi:O-antigen ligase family protein [Morganella morganii]|uniref:O-antigen ligase family protein n=1 Tax=Morganella morganii TaxID=582 RepID=UPI0034E4C231